MTFDFCMVVVTIISNLIPDRASFDHFCSTLRKRKECITVFDQSPPNFGNLKMNKLSNFWLFRISLKFQEKRLLRFKIGIFFLHFCVSRVGTHDISDVRLGTSTSRWEHWKLYCPIRIETRLNLYTAFENFKKLWLFRIFKFLYKLIGVLNLIFLLYLCVSRNGSKICCKQAAF